MKRAAKAKKTANAGTKAKSPPKTCAKAKPIDTVPAKK